MANEIEIVNDNALATNAGGMAFDIEAMAQRCEDVQRLKKRIMKKDIHYGILPGTKKNVLYKPGADMLALSFGIDVQVDIEVKELNAGHREYIGKGRAIHTASGRVLATGFGSCSTMESKYRWRSENTGELVPKEYWKDRDKDLLGGYEFSVKKVDGAFYIFHKVENDAIEDTYNTVMKMCDKRTRSGVIINATACGDIFMQEDLDDDKLGNSNNTTTIPGKPEVVQPVAVTESNDIQSNGEDEQKGKQKTERVITQKQVKFIYAKMHETSSDLNMILEMYGLQSLDKFPASQLEELISFMQDGRLKKA